MLLHLHLENTTIWQHRFLDYFSPNVALYMKSTLQNILIQFQTGLPGWIFQIWPKILKSDPVLVYITVIFFFFEHFLGQQWLAGLLSFPKKVLEVKNPKKN
jgi:hypothetical protein